MAMAMATAVAGTRILGTSIKSTSVSASCSSSSSSSSSVVAQQQLCSSFSGLSVSTWQKQRIGRYGGDISGFSGVSSAPNMSTTPKLVFTVAKMKTHKASAKRFRVTSTGKIMRRHACKQHLLRKKNSNRKRRLSAMKQVNRCDYDNVIGALPYLKVKGRLT
ncbi:unnamed protein product [Calypogeia fissa]